MATPHKFKFYIYQVVGGVSYYYTVSSGVVSSTTTKDGSELEFSPTNWDDIEKAWSRSRSMHGIINKLSNEYQFWGDGGKILKYLIFTYGYDVKARLLVEIRKDSDWLYETFSDNDIKLSIPKTDIDGVSVELFDTGMASDFMANLDTPYEIPLTGSDVITVDHEGTQVIGRYNYRYGASSLAGKFFGEVAPGGAANGEYLSHLLVVLPSEGLRPVAIEKQNSSLNMGEHFQNIFYVGGGGTESQQYSNFSLFVNQYIGNVKINYKAKFNWFYNSLSAPPGGIFPTCYFIVDVIVAKNLQPFRIRQRIYTGTPRVIPPYYAPPYALENIDVSDIDIGFLEEDDQLYFCVAIMTNSSTPTLTNTFDVATLEPENSRVSVVFKFENDKSDVDGFRLHKLAEKTVEKFADGKYGSTPFSSNFLSNPSSWMNGTYPYRTIITNGNAIKGINDSVFKVTMKDIIDDVQSNYGLGVGVNGNQLQIEPINTFYDDSLLIADLGELTDVQITPTNDIATLLIFGHKFDNDNDILSGAFDYNTKSTFKSPNITNLESKKEYVSPIISSIYNIERQRVSEAGKDSTGNKVNEDLYKLGVVDTAVGGKYKLNYAPYVYGSIFAALGTLEKPYNVEFSPKNMYLRLKNIINSNAYPSTTQITFQKSERYKGMKTLYYDINTSSYTSLLDEDEGFSPDGTDLVWLPFEIKCKAIYPMNLDALLKANPYGKFKGTYKGVEIHFFLNEAKQKPSNQNNFDMEGVLTPSTNILDLIF
jgi:hypothetical protein